MIKKILLAICVMVAVSSAWAVGSPPVSKMWYTFEGKPKSTIAPTDGDCAGVAKPAGMPTGATMGGPISFTGSTTYCRVLLNGSIYGNKVVGGYGMETLCEPDPTVQPVNGICPSYCPKIDTPYKVRTSYGVGALGAANLRNSDLPQSSGPCQIVIKSVIGCYTINATGDHICDFMATAPGVPLAGDPNAVGGATGANSSPVASTDKREVPPAMSRPTGATSCPEGSVDAGVDSAGITKCVGMGTAPVNAAPPPPKTTLPTTTTTNADGSTTTTSTVKSTNSDGSVTTTTNQVTTMPDGTSTTKVDASTGTTPGGADGKADDPNDVNDLCKRNPLLSICRNSTVSGSCEAVSCTGDAIQCATLRAASALQCQAKKDSDSMSTAPGQSLGASVLAGSDPNNGTVAGIMAGTSVDLSNPNLDQSGFVSGSCFPARTFTVAGKTVTMDFTGVCNGIQPLRYVVLACAFLTAYLIVSRSVLQG